jgi:hypothetical protein
MKGNISIWIFVVFLFSCQSDIEKGNGEIENTRELKTIPPNKVEVMVYEGCEYILYREDADSNSSFGFMAHKGNCSNPIHEYKKELK